MKDILTELLSDKKSDIVFNCLGIWHILYLIIILSVIISLIFILKNKNEETKNKAINISIIVSFSLYMLDFFLMPFAYSEIDIEKLPFHICTVTCVLCFMSRYNKFLSKYQIEFAILGLIGNMIYLIYPAGVGWYQVHPLSYRVIQTLLYHGCMTTYGLFVLTLAKPQLNFKKSYKELIIISGLVVWALIGNTFYNSSERFYNWFFVVQDPFGLIPLEISQYIMPFFMVMFIYAFVLIIYVIYNLFNKKGESI